MLRVRFQARTSFCFYSNVFFFCLGGRIYIWTKKTRYQIKKSDEITLELVKFWLHFAQHCVRGTALRKVARLRHNHRMRMMTGRHQDSLTGNDHESRASQFSDSGSLSSGSKRVRFNEKTNLVKKLEPAVQRT